MNKVLTLQINQNDDVYFVTVADLQDIEVFYTIFKAYLNTDNKLIKIHRFSTGRDFYDFICSLEEALNNERKISKELGKNVNLGLLWNEHTQKIILAEEAGKPLKSWDWSGDDLLFLGNKADEFSSCITFLYNDEQGNIVLEVSSTYPWFFGEDPPEDLYVSYDDWLPEYKILYKTIISKDTVQKWIKEMIAFRDMLEEKITCCKE